MSKLDEAIKFAVDAHSGQLRKMFDSPYVLHPLEAAAIIGRLTNDEDIRCAAVLHDVVEDTDVGIDEIRARFGERVASLVAAETENKRKELPPEATWRVRKEETLAHLKNTDDIAVRFLWMGDKLSNMRSLLKAYYLIGDGVWNYFNNKDKKDQEWYYRSVADALRPSMAGTAAFKEYEAIIGIIFGND